MKRLLTPTIYLLSLCSLFAVIPFVAQAAVVDTASSNASLNRGLMGYWTFDGKDMPNGVAIDKSGNGNNGNTSGIASSTFYTEGKIGQAGKFDGVNDYVDAGTTFTDTGSFTISLWVKSNTTSDMVFF